MADAILLEESAVSRKHHWGMISKYRQEIMGFACVWIMLFHNFCVWPDGLGWYITKSVIAYGNLGVDIFLLLSGVGLFYSFNNVRTLKRFYLNRYTRLLIPYIIIVVPYWIWRDLYLCKGDFLIDVTQLSFVLHGNSYTWYIAASAVLYLLFPLIYFYQNSSNALGINLSRTMKTILMCLAGFILLLIMYFCFRQFYDRCEIALTRSIVFVVGCHVGKLVKEERKLEDHWILASGLFCAIYFIFREMCIVSGLWIRLSGIPYALAACIFLSWLLDKRWMAWSHIVFRFFGERSLELYLTHVLLKSVYSYYFSLDLFDKYHFATYGVVIVCSVLLSALLHPVIAMLSKMILKK